MGGPNGLGDMLDQLADRVQGIDRPDPARMRALYDEREELSEQQTLRRMFEAKLANNDPAARLAAIAAAQGIPQDLAMAQAAEEAGLRATNVQAALPGEFAPTAGGEGGVARLLRDTAGSYVRDQQAQEQAGSDAVMRRDFRRAEPSMNRAKIESTVLQPQVTRLGANAEMQRMVALEMEMGAPDISTAQEVVSARAAGVVPSDEVFARYITPAARAAAKGRATRATSEVKLGEVRSRFLAVLEERRAKGSLLRDDPEVNTATDGNNQEIMDLAIQEVESGAPLDEALMKYASFLFVSGDEGPVSIAQMQRQGEKGVLPGKLVRTLGKDVVTSDGMIVPAGTKIVLHENGTPQLIPQRRLGEGEAPSMWFGPKPDDLDEAVGSKTARPPPRFAPENLPAVQTAEGEFKYDPALRRDAAGTNLSVGWRLLGREESPKRAIQGIDAVAVGSRNRADQEVMRIFEENLRASNKLTREGLTLEQAYGEMLKAINAFAIRRTKEKGGEDSPKTRFATRPGRMAADLKERLLERFRVLKEAELRANQPFSALSPTSRLERLRGQPVPVKATNPQRVKPKKAK